LFELRKDHALLLAMSFSPEYLIYRGLTVWRWIAHLWLRLFCEVKVISRGVVREDKNLLFISKNLSLAGALALQAELGKPLTVIICARKDEVGRLACLCPALNFILVANRDTVGVVEQIVMERGKGQATCLLRIGLDDAFLEEVVRKSRSTVLPCHALNTSAPDLSLRHEPLACLDWPTAQAIGFGFTVSPEDFTGAGFRQAWGELNAELAETHSSFQGHLGRACVAGLKRRQYKTIMTDSYQGGRSLSAGMLLAVAWELSLWLKATTKAKRIGIVLPPGLGVTILNLACVLANKTPVNLNFTLGRAGNESAIRTAELTVIITAEQLVKKLEDFPWTKDRIDLVTVLKSFPKPQLLWRRVLVFFQSAESLMEAMGIPEHGGEAEGGLLFTSGSSGDPKGVVLSHKNILANVAQIDAILTPSLVGSLMGCLPIFHSFGFTATLWWPLISGPQVVTYISPLEVGKIVEAIEKYKVELLITTPTFLRGYLRKAKTEQLESLNLVVTGAEKLPPPLREEFESKFGVPVCEGYGMTETTPVIGVNVPEQGMPYFCGEPLLGKKDGTIGQPCPAVAIKVCHLETGEEIASNQSGLLWFKGPNVFGGYLKDPVKTAAVLVDGWYMSGDVGHVDGQGFLHIEGRLSRFSKIAGEMVPHGTVEQYLYEIVKATTEDEVMIVVMGVADEQKGEALIALTTQILERDEMRKAFAARGLPNLWMPKHFVHVEQVPLLASGKLDLKNCQKLVEVAAAKNL